MSNERGSYGNNGVSREVPLIGYAPPQVGATHGGGKTSILKWVVGGAAVGLAALWMRHTSAQIEELYRAAGLSHQSFGRSLRADVRTLPKRTRGLLRGKARPARSTPTVAELVTSPGEKA